MALSHLVGLAPRRRGLATGKALGGLAPTPVVAVRTGPKSLGCIVRRLSQRRLLASLSRGLFEAGRKQRLAHRNRQL